VAGFWAASQRTDAASIIMLHNASLPYEDGVFIVSTSVVDG
jgi:hypothetical protein